jgi:thiol peroxidase
MSKSNDKITLQGNLIEISGSALKEGTDLPKVKLSNSDLKDEDLSKYAGKVLVISVIPSIDTPVCQLQTKHFNKEASSLSQDVAIVTVSRDLPFALKRWCAAEGIDQVEVLSDYKYRTFGEAFGVDIPNVGILARAVFVIGRDSKVKLVQYVNEVGNEPVYEEVIAAIKENL